MASSSTPSSPWRPSLSRRPLPVLLALLLPLGAIACESPPDEGAPGPADPVGETAEAAPPRGMAWVIFGADTVHAEVAATPEERERGLMFRETLDPGTGMLFVFEDSRTRSFWMQDTYIPLDIAYLDANLRIVDIQQMEPQSTEFYESARPAMFALEVPQGWFAEQGIEVGDEAQVVFGRR